VWPEALRRRAQGGHLKTRVVFKRAADKGGRPGWPGLVYLDPKRCSTHVDQRVSGVVDRCSFRVERQRLDPHDEWRFAGRNGVDIRVPAIAIATPDVRRAADFESSDPSDHGRSLTVQSGAFDLDTDADGSAGRHVARCLDAKNAHVGRQVVAHRHRRDRHGPAEAGNGPAKAGRYVLRCEIQRIRIADHDRGRRVGGEPRLDIVVIAEILRDLRAHLLSHRTSARPIALLQAGVFRAAGQRQIHRRPVLHDNRDPRARAAGHRERWIDEAGNGDDNGDDSKSEHQRFPLG
jgi:hypothetical protein